MKCTLSDLRFREVINTKTGQRLGYITDAEIDMTDGRVTALIVPGQRKLGGLMPGDADYCLPWGSITLMGSDLILTESCEPLHRSRPEKKPPLL